MSGRPAGALLGMVTAFLLVAPPAAAQPARAPAGGATTGTVAGAPAARDVVLGRGDSRLARTSATSTEGRYPVDDGTGATIAVLVTAACRLVCTDSDPQRIASTVGTFLHGDEIERLTVQLDAPFEIPLDCGAQVVACYFAGPQRIVLSGNDTPAPDGAGRDLVLAHEYGHHVARNRRSPAPFPAPLLWGTPRWSSHENVCRQRRAGFLFPGAGPAHYYLDPGEAFAEAFARLHFPAMSPRWKWPKSLRPGPGAFQAIREDTLDPWVGPTRLIVTGRTPPQARGATVRPLRTPLDGNVRIRNTRLPRSRTELGLRSPHEGSMSRARLGVDRRFSLEHTVCGEAHLDVILRSARKNAGSSFRLKVQRP